MHGGHKHGQAPCRYRALRPGSRFLCLEFSNVDVAVLDMLTGLTLPFLSYGGSSMFAQSLGVGVLLAVSLFRTAEDNIGGFEPLYRLSSRASNRPIWTDPT